MTVTFAQVEALDAALAAKGFDPMTPWWRAQWRRFYEHPTASTWVARVGRGGIKSTTAVKFALAETLLGEFEVPPGECHFFAFVSLSKDEATQRLRLLEAYLRALGVRYHRSADVIELIGRGRGFRVFSCSVNATSGFRCIGALGDEVSKWRNSDTNQNPAGEVIASLRAMMVTHPKAREAYFSSPLATTDWHYQAFEQGDTAHQVTSQAPTWVANPSITEEQTRRLERDQRIWRREYGAIPQAAVSAAFDADAIDRAFVWPMALGERQRRVLVIDASSGKKDAWTFGRCGWAVMGDQRRLVFDAVDGFEGSFWSQLSGDELVRRIATTARAHHITTVHGDQRESLMLRAAFQSNGLRFVEHPWTSVTKERAVAMVRRWLAEDMLVLPEHAKLRRELLEFEEVVTAAGAFTFGARGKGHDDYVALLLTAAMAEARGMLAGSPRRSTTAAYGGLRDAFRGSLWKRRDVVTERSEGMQMLPPRD